MNITHLSIPEVYLIEPNVFDDERGFFFESFNQSIFETKTGLKRQFIQDNHSKSQKGVLRGLHYQLPPKPQGKLVRVVQGEVFDVAVDIRKNSPFFGKWVGVHLSSKNKKQLWIPEGFAHGFLTLSETAEFLYKTTNFYAPEYESGIHWKDPLIDITWPEIGMSPLVSKKDQMAPGLEKASLF